MRVVVGTMRWIIRGRVLVGRDELATKRKAVDARSEADVERVETEIRAELEKFVYDHVSRRHYRKVRIEVDSDME